MWEVVQLFTYSGYPVFLYVCIPVYVHSPEESITCPVGSLSYAIETGLALSLVPVILLSLHTSPTHAQSTAVIDVHQQVPMTLLPLHYTYTYTPRVIGAYTATPSCLCGCWDPNLGPHTYIANAFTCRVLET